MADRRPSGGKGRPPGKSSGGPRPPGNGRGGHRSSGGPGPRGGRPQGGKPQGGKPARFERAGGKDKDKDKDKAKSGAEKGERLQKVLAQAGVGSRRACEELIKQGRVTVDGKTVRELGVRVEPMRADIAVDGEKVKLERAVYYAVNKPKGYVSTNDDPAGRPRVVDILAEVPERVYTVGRLDEESTGLMILTNDGELANRLAHPRYGVEKIYRAVVAGAPSPDVLRQLAEGVWLSDGKARAKRAKIIGARGESTILELALAEGKNREVRRMLARFGHKVMSLTRVAIGPISLRGLPVGEFRPLNPVEIDSLHKVAAGLQVDPPKLPSRGRGLARGKGQGRRRQEEHAPRSRRNELHDREGRGPQRVGGRPPHPADHDERPAPGRYGQGPDRGQGPGQERGRGPQRPPRAGQGQGHGPEREMERRPPRPGQGRGPQSGPGRPPGDRGPRQHQRPEGPGGRPSGPPRPYDRSRGPGEPPRVVKPPPGPPPSQRRPGSVERPAPPADEPKMGRRVIGLAPQHRPEADGSSGGPKGPNVRKRPTTKRVPPRKAFGIKRRKPGEEG